MEADPRKLPISLGSRGHTPESWAAWRPVLVGYAGGKGRYFLLHPAFIIPPQPTIASPEHER